jgi:hypothetical protein
VLFNHDIGPGVRTAPLQLNRKIRRFMNRHMYGNAQRRSLGAAFACIIVCAAAMPAGRVCHAEQPVRLNFDTSALTYSPDPQYVSLYNGGASSLTGSNIYVSIQGGAGFSATIGTGSLSFASGTWSYVTASSTSQYASTMSQAFSVADLQATPLQLVSANASRFIFSYGTNAYGYAGSSPAAPPGTPLSPSSARYSVIEVNYGAGGGNGVDLTNIDQFGGSLQMTARNSSSAVTHATGNSRSSQEMMTRLVAVAGGTGSTLVVNSASQVASVTGLAFSGTSSAYGNLQQYLGTVWNGSGTSTLKSPLLTNILDDAYPGGLGATGWTSGSTTGTTTPIVSPNTTYNVGYYFNPTITATTVNAATYHGVTFSGSVTIVSATTTGPVLKTYTGLTINVLTGTDGSQMNAYLNSGGPTSDTNIQLTGTGWADFYSDFYLPNNNSSAAPDITLVNTGSNSALNIPYGQVVQKVIGDFQEAVVSGLYGNIMSGTYAYYENNLPVAVSGTAAAVGELRSSLWWQNPSLAYSNTDTSAKNLYSNEVFPNSFVTGTGGFSAAYGGVYGAPFDDRYGNVIYEPQFGNTFALPTDGGSLTVKFLEGVPVPEPSGVALLTVMGATASGMAWRRRQRKSSAGG